MVALDGALTSFTNIGLITLVRLVLVTTVLEKTVLLDKLSQVIGNSSLVITLIKLYFLTTLLSSVAINTAAVALFIGVVRRNQVHAPA